LAAIHLLVGHLLAIPIHLLASWLSLLHLLVPRLLLVVQLLILLILLLQCSHRARGIRKGSPGAIQAIDQVVGESLAVALHLRLELL
jgi:hypothetical protein